MVIRFLTGASSSTTKIWILFINNNLLKGKRNAEHSSHRVVVRHLDLSFVSLHNGPAQIQPQSQTPPVIPDFVTPTVKFLKDLCLLLIRNTVPIVSYPDHSHVPVPPGAYCHRTSLPRIFYRIIHHIGNHLDHQFPVRLHKHHIILIDCGQVMSAHLAPGMPHRLLHKVA